MVDPELLKVLCCPESHLPVHPADSVLLRQLNARIGSTGLRNRAGRTISEPLEEGLVRADGKLLFPIRKGIPVMLMEESIPVG